MGAARGARSKNRRRRASEARRVDVFSCSRRLRHLRSRKNERKTFSGFFLHAARRSPVRAAAGRFLETATLRSGVALAGGHAFGAYLGAETFPGAGRGLTGPLRVACAACAWLLAHVASPETNARAAGPAAWLAFGVGAAGVLAAGWSQRDPGRPAFGVDERDERLRREEARLGVLGAAVGLAAMVAFALKTAAGGGWGWPRGCAGAGAGRRRRGGTTPTTTTTTTTTTNPPPPAPSRRRTTRRRGAVCGAGGPAAPPRTTSPVNRTHAKNANSARHLRSRSSAVAARAPAWKRVRVVGARCFARARNGCPRWETSPPSVRFWRVRALSARLADDPDTATFVVAPVLLMLHEDGALFTSSARRAAVRAPSGRRRHAAARRGALGRANVRVRRARVGANAAAAAAWGAGEERSASPDGARFSQRRSWRSPPRRARGA